MAETASPSTTGTSTLQERPRVLVVDDEPGVRQVIRVNLVMQGHEVVEAKNGAQALRALEENGIDLVVLDLMMPKVSGWDVLEAVRQRRGSRAIPIIVLSAVTTEDAKIKAFELGASDYIVKPFAVGELLARVNRTLHERKEKQVLAEFSITDWVTGLFNRRYLELRLPQEVSRAHRYQRPLAALFFEVDQLPWLLEERGPQFVDGILQEVTSLVRGETRACDVLFRYDGDYFVALLPDTPLGGGIEVANRIRKRMLETEWNQEVGLSGTFGVVELQEGEDAAKFLTRAEEALLAAKRAGGNSVWPLPESSESPAVAQAIGSVADYQAQYESDGGAVEMRPPSESYPETSPAIAEYPVESGPAEPIIAPEEAAGAGLHGAEEYQYVEYSPELQSGATQRIDPAVLDQLRQQMEATAQEGELGQSASAEPQPVQEWDEQAAPEQWNPSEGWQESQQWDQSQGWDRSQQLNQARSVDQPQQWQDTGWETYQYPTAENGGVTGPDYQRPDR